MTRHAYWLLFAVGCASPMSALRDDNRRLTNTVTELRTDKRSRERKLADLQRQLDLARAQAVSAQVDLSVPPSLPVEVASPEATERVVGMTEDGTEIVYEGDALGRAGAWEYDAPRRATPPSPQRPIASDDRIEVTRPRAAARTARPVPREREVPTERSGDAQAAYRDAVELVKAGKHDDAIAALRGFLGKHARHDYADNAQYWLGEAFYAKKDFAQALIEFRNVIETYPRGNKVPDALLKVGYCYASLGQSDKARAVLEQVVNLYPKTEPAALAAKRLETR
ncbi:MAG: tol-pal system protein YbgF [Kofleriaceae bacterium]